MGGLLTEQIAARRAWEGIKPAYDEEFQTHVAMTMKSLDLAGKVGIGVPNVSKSVT